MENKTNVIRILEKHKIKYTAYSYNLTKEEMILGVSGVEVARRIQQDPNRVFKTLVTVGKSNKNYVFMIPVNEELSLKKAAKCVNEKSIEMIKSKELLPLTGYVHGGCSPLGMKKVFETVIHETAILFASIIFSAGKIGDQMEIQMTELETILSFQLEDVVE